MTVENILVPVDFSVTGSRAALELAAIVAKARGARLKLLHVLSPAGPMASVVPGPSDEGPDQAERAQALDLLERQAAFVRATGVVDVEVVLSTGYAADEIVRQSLADHTDLVVMATRGRTGMQRFVMGSIAAGVMKHARCAVVTVRGPS